MGSIIFLIVILWDNGASPKERFYPMPTMEKCIEVLKETKVHTAQRADENEKIAVVTCGGKL